MSKAPKTAEKLFAVLLFKVWCEAARAWRASPSDVTAARCRVARDDYKRATAEEFARSTRHAPGL